MRNNENEKKNPTTTAGSTRPLPREGKGPGEGFLNIE